LLRILRRTDQRPTRPRPCGPTQSRRVKQHHEHPARLPPLQQRQARPTSQRVERRPSTPRTPATDHQLGAPRPPHPAPHKHPDRRRMTPTPDRPSGVALATFRHRATYLPAVFPQDKERHG
jgi:hypothetical protein